MQKVSLFTAHGELEGEVSVRTAHRMLRDGDAHPMFQRRSHAQRVLIGIRRVLGQIIERSSPTLTIAEVERAMSGNITARQKFEQWPITGTPALRHAQ